MNKQPKIVIIGSVNIDLIMRIEQVPKTGEILTNAKFSTACGGKGDNQTVALARLGA